MFRMQFPVRRMQADPVDQLLGRQRRRHVGMGRRQPRSEARAFWTSTAGCWCWRTHNTDYGDSWEREAEDPDYFSPSRCHGYAFGINVLLYAMSH